MTKPTTEGSRPAQGSGGAPLKRPTVATLTLDAIREKILWGDYAEGSPLRQDAIAAELGVSRIPVREALRQLEVEGLVTFSPHCGAVVSVLSLAEIKELFELRALIEVELLRRAVPFMDEESLTRASEILDHYEVALQRGNVSEWGSLNWEFHSVLYAPAKQPLTMGIVQNLQNQSDRYFRMQLALTHGESRANEEHRAILAAVSQGDSPHACSLLTSHILGAGRSLLEFLREHRRKNGS
jgi:DNA-binding GntR family transcriptional regulator